MMTIIWPVLTILVGAIAAFISYGYGYKQASIMEKSHALAEIKAAVRIDCSVRVEERQILGPGYNPHLAVAIRLGNEGELPAESLNGEWKFVPRDPAGKRVFLLQKDFLGSCESYVQDYLIKESANWRRERITFDVEVEFFYSVPAMHDSKEKGRQRENRCYKANYRYVGENAQMLKLSE